VSVLSGAADLTSRTWARRLAVAVVGLALLVILYEFGVANLVKAQLRPTIYVSTFPVFCVAVIAAATRFSKASVVAGWTTGLWGPQLGIIGLQLIDYAVAGALLVVVVTRLRGAPQRARHIVLRLCLPYGLFCIVIGGFWPQDLPNRELQIRILLLGTLSAMAMAAVGFEIKHVARALVVVGLPFAIASTQTAGIEGRDVAVLGQNVNAAAFLIAIALIAAVVGCVQDRRLFIPLYLASLPLLWAGIWACRSRGSFIIIVMSVLAILCHRLYAGRNAAGWIGLATFAVLSSWVATIVFTSAGQFTERFVEGADLDTFNRRTAFEYFLYRASLHPLTGAGLGNAVAEAEADPFAVNADLNSHDMFSGVASQVGFIPLGLFLALVLAALLNARAQSRWTSALLVPIIVSLFSLNWVAASILTPVELSILVWIASYDPPRPYAGRRRQSVDATPLGPLPALIPAR